MRASVPILLALAVVGTSACDRQDVGCYDRSEAHVRISTSLTSLPLPTEGESLDGSFSTWGVGEVVFDAGGVSVGFDLELEDEAVIPDLHADSVGTVTLEGWDFTGSSTAPTEPTIRVSNDDGTLFILGNGEWSSGDGGWDVSSPRDMDTCTTYERDGGSGRHKPVFLTLGDASARLLQGDTAVLGGLDVTVLSAQSNNRSHPWAPCSTADCPWEKLSWMAVAPGLEIPEAE
ncbi:MAG: hypothetical protein KDA24_18335 [Deltaproteobacteria bacterium]|nr:hypothetical protein [Deltaproteobacteria bacterium]